MVRKRHEPTQPKNPHQLAVSLHIHSKACIERFADASGVVSVLRKGTSKPFSKRPDDRFFCCQRAWSEHLERGLFKHTEDAFQAEVDSILRRGTVLNHRAVSEYFAVWGTRAEFAANPPADVVLDGIQPDSLTKDQEEIVEKNRMIFLRGNAVPGRLAASPRGILRFDSAMEKLREVRWSVLRRIDGPGFICPDRAMDLFLPISPDVALLVIPGGVRDQDVGADSVSDANRQIRHQAPQYVFGLPRDIATGLAK